MEQTPHAQAAPGQGCTAALRTLVDLSSDALVVLLRGWVLHGNRSAAALLGWDCAGAAGSPRKRRHLLEFADEASVSVLRAALATLETVRGDDTVVRATIVSETGARTQVEVRGALVADDPRGLVALALRPLGTPPAADPTEPLTREPYASFLDGLPFPAFVKDGAGRYVHANERLRIAAGRTDVQWTGRTDADLFPAPVAARLGRADAAARDAGGIVQRVIELPDGEDGHMWLVTRSPIEPPSAPGVVSDGEEPRWLGGSWTDVTARIEAERERIGVVEAERAARANAVRRLKALSRRLLDVQESERRRIARELHDDVGQLVTGLKLRMDADAGHAAPRRGTETREIVDDVLARVRDLSMSLMPPMLDDLGLLPALLWLADRFTGQTRVRVSFRHAGLDRRLPRDVELGAFRVVQEAITNAARHAAVAEVRVGVWATHGGVAVEIEDDGCGFAAERAFSGASVGLPGMRERVRLLGGRFAIESAPGAGTRVTAFIPVPTETSAEA